MERQVNVAVGRPRAQGPLERPPEGQGGRSLEPLDLVGMQVLRQEVGLTKCQGGRSLEPLDLVEMQVLRQDESREGQGEVRYQHLP